MAAGRWGRRLRRRGRAGRPAAALSLAARRIAAEFGGAVPHDLEALRSLPGVGPYTSAAVASIAFGTALPAIDTNVARVVARVRLGVDASSSTAGEIAREAERWIDRARPGEWNQALMDLGRDVCRPAPRCERCPLARRCRARRTTALGRPASPPHARRPPRFEGSDRQVRGAIVRALRGSDGSLSIERLAGAAACSPRRIASVLPGLVADGLVAAGPGAMRGDPRGRVRLAER